MALHRYQHRHLHEQLRQERFAQLEPLLGELEKVRPSWAACMLTWI